MTDHRGEYPAWIPTENEPTSAELAWWEAGGHPPWKRVWREGVDITDQPIATWPWPWNAEKRPARSGRRSGRARGARWP